jgi:hypothetical protein
MFILTILLPFVRASVTLVPELDHGGWPNRPRYMPHIVIGDPSQGVARVVDGNVGMEHYLGVWFIKAPDELTPGKNAEVTLCLMYWPEEPYEEVVPGATFTVREGLHVVGFGRVLDRSEFPEKVSFAPVNLLVSLAKRLTDEIVAGDLEAVQVAQHR